MSPLDRNFTLLLFTGASENSMWYSPALVTSNPQILTQYHQLGLQPQASLAMCDIMSSMVAGERKEFEIWSSRSRCLQSHSGLVKDIKKPRTTVAKSSLSQVWRQEFKVNTYTELIPDSALASYLASRSGPHGWVTTSTLAVISPGYSVPLSVSSSETPVI